MTTPENSIKALKNFFSTDDNPCSTGEIMAWWRDLSDEEKDYYKSADLS